MKKTLITGNGNFALPVNEITESPEITIYMPSDIGTATVILGYLDGDNVVVPYTDGELLVAQQKRVRCGNGVRVYAIITSYSANFNIGVAD